MADWGGFTEEDLRQLAYPGKIDMGKSSGGTPKKQASFGKQKGKNANRDRSFSQQKKRVTLSDVVEVMPVDQMLNPDSLSNGDAGSPSAGTKSEAKVSPTKPQNPKTPPKSVLKPSKPIERQVSRTNSNSFGNEGTSSNDISLNNAEGSRELNEEEALNRELNQIQKFQHQQKLIEEKNKQTKTLLAQAIKERRARAESEAHLLTDLQTELSRLDTLLTTDVSIIRDRIETACLEYTESLKRYEKAEKEFVGAKMELFRKAEIKEKLTEHLYTIIYQNEMRKAQKLSELMEMLELTTTCEEVECVLPAIPPIPMYNPVQTLYSPGKCPPTTKESGTVKTGNVDPTVKTGNVDPTVKTGNVDPTVKPGNVDPTVKPGNVDPTVKPGNADPTVKPGNADPTVKPGNADPTVKPGNADPTVKPGNADPTVKPGNADPTVKPGNADPTVKPGNADPTVKPGNADPTVKPGNADPTVKPGNADPTVKPGNADPTVKPGNADPTVKPGNADPTVKPGNADPTVKLEASGDQKVVDQSVGSDIPTEGKESLSEGSVSSLPTSEISEEALVKQNESNTTGDAVSSPLQNSLATSTTAKVKGAVDPSVKSVEISEASKEDGENEEHGVSSSDCNISDSNSMAETENISSLPLTNSERKRTNKEKKTTLKELAQ